MDDSTHQETKGDVRLPDIGRSDAKAEMKASGDQETKKDGSEEDRDRNKKTNESMAGDDQRNDHRDDKSESKQVYQPKQENKKEEEEDQEEDGYNPTFTKSNEKDGSKSYDQEFSPKTKSNDNNNNNDNDNKYGEKEPERSKNEFDENERQKKSSSESFEKKESKSSNSELKSKGYDDNNETKSEAKGTRNQKNESERSNSKNVKSMTMKDNNETKSPRREKRGESKSRGSERERRNEDYTQDGEKSERGTSKNSGEMTNRSSNGDMSEGRNKQKEFFKMELKRLESSLKRESSKIIEPTKKPHTPYIFNTLEPYYNTRMTRFIIELPDEMKHGHTSRRTAQGLTDPWLDLKMDREILPRVASKPVSRQVAILKKEKELRDRKKRSAMSQSGTGSKREGSTRLPKFPMVQLESSELSTKQLFYSDVPSLRTELKNKYSSSARAKIDEDYKRTHADFYRMELDKLDEVHPINRSHMRSAYFAYLQNTPGSKKAINECVRGLKSGKAQ